MLQLTSPGSGVAQLLLCRSDIPLHWSSVGMSEGPGCHGRQIFFEFLSVRRVSKRNRLIEGSLPLLLLPVAFDHYVVSVHSGFVLQVEDKTLATTLFVSYFYFYPPL